MTETPQTPEAGASETAPPFTQVGESDPNADSAEGLAGDLGVSSERKGPVRGQDGEVTYATASTHDEEDTEADPGDDVPPEQSAYDGQPETNPDSPGRHESDPGSNPRHGV